MTATGQVSLSSASGCGSSDALSGSVLVYTRAILPGADALGAGYWTPSVYLREPGVTSGGNGREFGQSVGVDGVWPVYTLAVGVPMGGMVHVVTVTAALSIGGEGSVSAPHAIQCVGSCGSSAATTQYGGAVSVTSDGLANRVVVVGSPLDDGCGGGLAMPPVVTAAGCAGRGGVYVYEWTGSVYFGVAVYKGLAASGRVGSSVSSRRFGTAGVVVGVGSPRDDNTALSGKVTMYTGGGVAGGAGHMLRRVGGAGTGWSVVHTAKPMHPYNVGHDAEMGSSVDVGVQSATEVRAFYCARGDRNARGGEHPAEFKAGEPNSGALFIVREP
jgi:hypothetical protein